MDVLVVLRWIGRMGLGLVLLLAPVLLWRRCVVLADSALWRLSIRPDMTVLAGAMVGAALLGVILPQGALGFTAILGIGGPWQVSAAELPALLPRMLPIVAQRLRGALAADADGNLQVWLRLAMTLWLVQLLASLLARPPRGVLRLLFAEAGIFLLSVHVTLWTACMLLWCAHQLNIWLILLAILLIQDRRYTRPPYSARIAAALWGARLKPPRAAASKPH